MSHYWEEYTCDECGDPFTREEWCARETPHHIDCPNYDPDEDQEFVECTCDRNYHAACFDFDHDPELKIQVIAHADQRSFPEFQKL